MDRGDVESGPSTALVFLTYLLQNQGSGNAELQEELDSLGRELKHPPLDSLKLINSNGLGSETHDSDGELQTDGYFVSSSRELMEGLQLQVEPAYPAEAEVLRHVAAELREIADQLELRVVAQAAENLTKKLQKSSFKHWKSHLSLEVEWLVKQRPGTVLEHLPQEKAIMVLTMTLVKGVCERAPRLLRGLFNTALQYINSAMAR